MGVDVHDFEMFTDEGEAACQQLISRLRAEVTEGVVTRNMLPNRIRELCNIVSREGHGEVYDTEPQCNIADAVNALCKEQGWMPVSRWDW